VHISKASGTPPGDGVPAPATTGRQVRIFRLLYELRRRRVYQVAAFYAVAAWVIVEVASTTFPYLGLSDRAVTVLIIAALCGFPVAVALGWTFDLTPGGVVVTEAEPAASAGGRKGGRTPRLAAARAGLTGAVLILALIAGNWWVQRPPPAPAEPASLIVLPFANMSGDTEDDFFADGIMDEVIAHLSKVGGIRVISRTSAMRYRATERSVPEIAREVGVDAVLEGSVRRTGSDVRVTVQLVDGPTDTPIWGDQYDRRLENALAVQGDVAREVARALRVRLSPDERRRLRSQPTSSPAAFQAYLRGRYFWNQRSAEGLERAISEFQSALAADPDYSLAYAGLADAYAALAQYAARPPADVMPLARDAALHALALDPSLAEAHASLGMTRFWYDWDWAAADAAYRRALDLNPSYATAAHWRALLLASLGRHDEARAAIEQAVALDPVSPLIRTGRGLVRFYAGGRARSGPPPSRGHDPPRSGTDGTGRARCRHCDPRDRRQGWPPPSARARPARVRIRSRGARRRCPRGRRGAGGPGTRLFHPGHHDRVDPWRAGRYRYHDPLARAWL
jgi:adenylate cyclase